MCNVIKRGYRIIVKDFLRIDSIFSTLDMYICELKVTHIYDWRLAELTEKNEKVYFATIEDKT